MRCTLMVNIVVLKMSCHLNCLMVGKCALIGNLKEPASFGVFMAVYKTSYYKYVLHYLRSNQFRGIFDDGNSTGYVKEGSAPLPPVAEQERIVDSIGKKLSLLYAIVQ